jgi:membrane protein DedA with SNARE-associated domain
MLGSVSGSLTSEIASHGVYAVFVLMAIDAVFPVASELIMVYAGALAAGAFTDEAHISVFGGQVSFGWEAYIVLALAGTLGYLFGSIVGWGIGRYGGLPLLERHGRWLHVTPERLARADRWFDRWSTLAVLVGRVTPVIRSFISIPAGVFRVPFGRYVVLTAIGSAVWCFAFAAAGWAFGSSYERFHNGFRFVDYAFVAGIALGVTYLIYRKVRASRLNRRAADPAR